MTDAERSAELAAKVAALTPEQQALLARRLAERASQRRATAVRADRGVPAPLTRAQSLLWLHEQLTPGTSTYHVPMARRVVGTFEPDVFRRSLDVLVDRHEALRTAFLEIEGEARQTVLPPVAVVCEVHDLRHVPAPEREASAATLLHDVTARPFDLGARSAPRAAVVRLADESWVVLLVVHHIVCDGVSLGILQRELSALYAAGGDPMAAALPPVAGQLVDVAVREAAGRTSDAGARAATYWHDALEGANAEVALPTITRRPGLPTAPPNSVGATVGVGLGPSIDALARSTGTTPFSVLLASFAALMHRLSGQDDLLVAVPVAGRDTVETEGVVGHFADTLPVRVRVESHATFTDLLAQVRDALARGTDELVASSTSPLSLLPRGAGGASSSVGPNIAMVSQDGGGGSAYRLGDAKLTPYAIGLGNAKFEVTLSITSTAGGVRALLEYRSDLHDHASASALLERWDRLLHAVLRSPKVEVADVSVVLPREEELLLGAWRGTTPIYPRDAGVGSLFEAQVRRQPDAVAIVGDDVSLTYAEVDETSRRIAARLRSEGVRAGDHVALLLARPRDGVIAMLAVLRLGAAYVPLDVAFPDDRVATILADAVPAAILCDALRQDAMARMTQGVVTIDEALATPPLAADTLPQVRGDDVAYVMYTSGSTGTPKGARIRHRGIVRLVLATDYVAFGESEVLGQVSTLAFDAATFEVWGAWLHGARLALIDRDAVLEADALAAAFARHGVTTTFLTVALFNHVTRLAPHALTGRQVIFGGEAGDPRWVRAALAAGPRRLVNGYGPTEVTTFAVCHHVTDVADGAASIPIGRAIANTTAMILDARGRLVPPGVVGELHLGGDGVAAGYLNRPELTAERFLADPWSQDGDGRLYRTGDLVRHLAGGDIEFLGRRDNQVKLRGYRIELDEIESHLARCPGVNACAVLIVAEGDGERALVAYASAEPGGMVTGRALQDQLRARLPAFMVPSTIEVVDALPLNANGKIDRVALRARGVTRTALADDDVTPAGPVERVVALAMQEVLGVPRLGSRTSFFEAGGHSLLAGRVVAQLARIFRSRLTLRRFFDGPTAESLAVAVIDEVGRERAEKIATLLLSVRDLTPEARERLRHGTPAAAPTETDR